MGRYACLWGSTFTSCVKNNWDKTTIYMHIFMLLFKWTALRSDCVTVKRRFFRKPLRFWGIKTYLAVPMCFLNLSNCLKLEFHLGKACQCFSKINTKFTSFKQIANWYLRFWYPTILATRKQISKKFCGCHTIRSQESPFNTHFIYQSIHHTKHFLRTYGYGKCYVVFLKLYYKNKKNCIQREFGERITGALQVVWGK